MKSYIGIDPGASGAVVSLQPDGGYTKYVVEKIGKEIDISSLAKVVCQFKDKDCHAVLENVHSIFGTSAKSNFQFGRIFGICQALLEAYDIPYTLVTPKKWQKTMHEGIVVQKDKKKMSIAAAMRIFPDIDLRKSDRAKVPHDGVTDALLMAEYGRRMNL